MNYLVIFGSGAIPLIVGFLWYNNSFGFGKAWMAEIGTTEEALERNFNPLKIFGLTYLFGCMIAGALLQMTIHQTGLTSMLMGVSGVEDKTTEVGKAVDFLMTNYGQNFRTFKHGALHGTIYAVFLVLPVIGITALFERRSFKYIFIHFGFFAITLALMGGVVCQFMKLG